MESYAVEDGFVELEVLLLDLSDGGLHLLLDLADLLVALVDGDGLHLLGERQFLYRFLNFLQSDLALFLGREGRTKKSNISTINQYYKMKRGRRVCVMAGRR